MAQRFGSDRAVVLDLFNGSHPVSWDSWPSCDGPTLITNYAGTLTAYGIGVRDHYLARFGP